MKSKGQGLVEFALFILGILIVLVLVYVFMTYVISQTTTGVQPHMTLPDAVQRLIDVLSGV